MAKKRKKDEPAGFQVKKVHAYVALTLGIIALLGSFGVGFNLTTPGSTAAAALDKTTEARFQTLEKESTKMDITIARKHDQDISKVLAAIQTMETNILNQVGKSQDENNREQVRLIVQALKNRN